MMTRRGDGPRSTRSICSSRGSCGIAPTSYPSASVSVGIASWSGSARTRSLPADRADLGGERPPLLLAAVLDRLTPSRRLLTEVDNEHAAETAVRLTVGEDDDE